MPKAPQEDDEDQERCLEDQDPPWLAELVVRPMASPRDLKRDLVWIEGDDDLLF